MRVGRSELMGGGISSEARSRSSIDPVKKEVPSRPHQRTPPFADLRRDGAALVAIDRGLVLH